MTIGWDKEQPQIQAIRQIGPELYPKMIKIEKKMMGTITKASVVASGDTVQAYELILPMILLSIMTVKDALVFDHPQTLM